MVLIRTKFKGNSRFCYYYLITNLITGMPYVGCRLRNGKYPLEDTNYMGSSVHLAKDIKKYGIENFTKVILRHERFVNKELLCLHESMYMHQYQTLSPKGYNRYDPGKYPGFSCSGIKQTNERRALQKFILNQPKVKAKRSAKTKEMWKDEEFKTKVRSSMKKTWQDPEKKKRYKEAMNQPKVKAKVIAKLKEAHARHTTPKPAWLIFLEKYRKTLVETKTA